MKFTQISESDFRKFAAKSPYQSFMQTPEIAKLRQKSGWTPYYFAVIDDEAKTSKTPKTPKNPKSPKILAASLVVAKPTFLGKYQTFYAPGGPLLDLENRELTDFFFRNLANFAKSKNAYVLHINPYYELIERDRDGQIVENGFEHAKALLNLDHLGFKPLKNTSMPKYLFALDFEKDLANTKSIPLTPETVFSQFKQNTRNLTRRAERLGVAVRELNKEDLPILKQITSSTADRRHFSDQPLSYYQTMFDLFAPKDQVKFLLAEIKDPDDSAKTIPLSVAMFMLTGSEVVYLYSGSDASYMKKYNAQYLIQWHMIKYALENGFKRYNFYGIRGLPDKNAKDYGIYRFKKGFGGHVIHLIGSFELPINPKIYRLHSLLAKLKKSLLPR